MSVIIEVNDDNYEQFMTRERVALILTRATCGNCANYTREIEALCGEGALEGIEVGKVVLDKAGSLKLKRQNPWIKNVEFLPHTTLFHQGENVGSFSASKGSYFKQKVNTAWSSIG